MSDILVAYFSATGTTARVAHALASSIGAEIFVIEPKTPYSTADLNWHDKNSRTSIETADKACRPEIADKVADMEKYKTVFLGFPIWWYHAPKIIETFLEQYDFSDMNLVPFATSGGSPLGDTENILRQICPKANWIPGRRVPAMITEDELGAWAKGLGV